MEARRVVQHLDLVHKYRAGCTYYLLLGTIMHLYPPATEPIRDVVARGLNLVWANEPEKRFPLVSCCMGANTQTSLRCAVSLSLSLSLVCVCAHLPVCPCVFVFFLYARQNPAAHFCLIAPGAWNRRASSSSRPASPSILSVPLPLPLPWTLTAEECERSRTGQ